MFLRDLIFLFIGLTISIIILYIVVIKKFFKFINQEHEHNEVYRMNAEDAINKINEFFSPVAVNDATGQALVDTGSDSDELA